MTIELYCFGESGNAYKAALALELSGMDWTPVYVDFFNGETRGEAFREINPMGEVPVLRDGDVTLTQSGVMQMYVTEKTGRFGGARLDRRRGRHQCRPVLLWLPVLPRAVRFRARGLARDRPLAGEYRAPARLETPL